LAVVDEAAARAMQDIRAEVSIPLIADIHFRHELALLSIEAGVDGLRINPGNIGGEAKVGELVAAARERRLPIRIGVNAGSLEKDILEAHGGATPAALTESALRHVAMVERLDYHEIKISVKASDVARTVAAYRELSSKTDYPLHLGVTEAGSFMAGTVRSSVAMGMLLAEGIGDTMRVSLTDTPMAEVRVGLELLRSLGLREPGASVVSCPTCGRAQVDVMAIAGEVEAALEAYYAATPDAPHPLVAVMGCVVNGPGEARDVDLALAGGKGKFALYASGELIRTVPENRAVEELIEEVKRWKPAGADCGRRISSS
jgi:(E)-4-hydroxy-3-methylbut-2-enyl-diphosphate synthase